MSAERLFGHNRDIGLLKLVQGGQAVAEAIVIVGDDADDHAARLRPENGGGEGGTVELVGSNRRGVC